MIYFTIPSRTLSHRDLALLTAAMLAKFQLFICTVALFAVLVAAAPTPATQSSPTQDTSVVGGVNTVIGLLEGLLGTMDATAKASLSG